MLTRSIVRCKSQMRVVEVVELIVVVVVVVVERVVRC